MKEYRTHIQARTRWLVIGCVALVAIVALAMWYSLGVLGKAHPSDAALGFQAGVQTGLFLALLAFLGQLTVRYARALRSEQALQALRVRETDERNRYIKDRIGGIGLDLSICLLAAASVITGFFDRTVFFSLLGALALVSLAKAGLKLYFLVKM